MQFYPANPEALDQERAKDRRETVEQEGPRPFYLKPGITQIRILPPYSDRGVWYREIHEYNFKVEGQRRVFIAPASFGFDDPVAEKADELKQAGGEANFKAAKELQSRRQYLVNALVKAAPPGVEFNPGEVVVLKFGVKVKRQLLDLDRDVQGGWADITNPQSGVDLRITRSGQGLRTEYSVQPLPNRTSLQQDLQALGVDINQLQLHNLDELYPPKDYNELAMALVGYAKSTGFTAPPQPQQVAAPAPPPPAPPVAPQAPPQAPPVQAPQAPQAPAVPRPPAPPVPQVNIPEPPQE